MRILALESSAKAASVAIVNNGIPEAYAYQNTGLTHSRTLMPMVRDVLENAGLSLQEIDLVAAANGPGSFTGIRIGTAAAKGIALAAEKPGIGVSTLWAMACSVIHWEGYICCVMDARRNELYNAVFMSKGGTLNRLCVDRAISIEALAEELSAAEQPVLLVGDGAELSYPRLRERCRLLTKAPPHLVHQSAYGVAIAAASAAAPQKSAPTTAAGRDEVLTSLSALDPVYIRPSQAERERLLREQSDR